MLASAYGFVVVTVISLLLAVAGKSVTIDPGGKDAAVFYINPVIHVYNESTLIVAFSAYGRNITAIVSRRPHLIPTLSGDFVLSGVSYATRSKFLETTAYFEGTVTRIQGGGGSRAVFLLDATTLDPSTLIGQLDMEGDTLYIDPTPDNQTVVYRASEVHVDLPGFSKGCPQPPNVFELARRQRIKREYRPPIKKNRCQMKLVADYQFYKHVGGENYFRTLSFMITSVERANDIFKKIDFGNVNNHAIVRIATQITEVKINQQATISTTVHYNNEELPDGISENDFLNIFSREEGTDKTCITLLMTGKNMKKNEYGSTVLGVSNTGRWEESGACRRTPNFDGTFMNTGFVSPFVKANSPLITHNFNLVVAHELGHLFGASHDEQEEGCDLLEPGGKYIMSEVTSSGYDRNNVQFSRCSIDAMSKFFFHVVEQCFVEEKGSICGNGVAEPGEECDPGHTWSKDDDPCCERNCTLKPHAKCSPKHSECCTSQCGYTSKGTLCLPRDEESCRDVSYCPGTEANCPTQRYVEDGVRCRDNGTCIAGTCNSYCQTLNSTYRPCLCENQFDACYRCCKIGDTGKCRSLRPIIRLDEEALCIFGHCRKNKCEREVRDKPLLLQILNDVTTPGSNVFTKHTVFIFISLTLMLWIPISLYIYCRDTTKEEPSTPTSMMASSNGNSFDNIEMETLSSPLSTSQSAPALD